MSVEPVPTRVKISVVLVVLAMMSWFGVHLWALRDFTGGTGWAIGGLLKGVLVPAAAFLGEYHSVRKRDASVAKIDAIGWSAIGLVFVGHMVNAGIEHGIIVALLFSPIAAIPCYIAYAKIYWWQRLKMHPSPAHNSSDAEADRQGTQPDTAMPGHSKTIDSR